MPTLHEQLSGILGWRKQGRKQIKWLRSCDADELCEADETETMAELVTFIEANYTPKPTEQSEKGGIQIAPCDKCGSKLSTRSELNVLHVWCPNCDRTTDAKPTEPTAEVVGDEIDEILESYFDLDLKAVEQSFGKRAGVFKLKATILQLIKAHTQRLVREAHNAAVDACLAELEKMKLEDSKRLIERIAKLKQAQDQR